MMNNTIVAVAIQFLFKPSANETKLNRYLFVVSTRLVFRKPNFHHMTEEIYVFIARAYYHNGLPAFIGSRRWRLLFEEESFRDGDTVHIRESKAMFNYSVRKSIIEKKPELATPKQIDENQDPTVEFITQGASINLYLINIINARRESKKTV